MCEHVWIFEGRTLSTQPVRDDAACAVYPEWNQGAENRASRPMAGQIRRNPPGLPRVPRLGSRSYLRPISRCRPLTDTSPGRLLGGLAIA
jgi:hypothetical protein